MPHRCVAGGCSNTRKDGVSLHLWPEDPRFARLWTNAVKNTRSDFSSPSSSSRLCSAHFMARRLFQNYFFGLILNFLLSLYA